MNQFLQYFSDINIKHTILISIIIISSTMIVYASVYYFDINNGYWAVISIAAVSRPSIYHTTSKAMIRIIGTIIGGALAYLIMLYANNDYLIIGGVFLIAFFSGIIILQNNHLSYAGIVMGLTAIIVITASKLEGNFTQIFLERTGLVVLGIVVVYFCNILIRTLFGIKRDDEGTYVKILKEIKQAVKLQKLKMITPIALMLAIIVVATYSPWLIWQYAGGFWAPISCFFIIEESIFGVFSKMKLRFTAHLLALIIGFTAVSLSFTFPAFQIIGLCFGYIIASGIMVNAKNLSHTGNTFAIAITVMLLYNLNQEVTIDIILARFSFVLLGIITGYATCKLMKVLNHMA